MWPDGAISSHLWSTDRTGTRTWDAVREYRQYSCTRPRASCCQAGAQAKALNRVTSGLSCQMSLCLVPCVPLLEAGAGSSVLQGALVNASQLNHQSIAVSLWYPNRDIPVSEGQECKLYKVPQTVWSRHCYQSDMGFGVRFMGTPSPPFFFFQLHPLLLVPHPTWTPLGVTFLSKYCKMLNGVCLNYGYGWSEALSTVIISYKPPKLFPLATILKYMCLVLKDFSKPPYLSLAALRGARAFMLLAVT